MLDSTVRFLDSLLTVIGKSVALLVLGMGGLICLEMVSRGAFGISQPWTHEMSTWLLTTFIFLGGPYALLRGHFVRVDVVFGRLSPRSQALMDTTVSTALAALFIGVLIWRGGELFLSSYAMNERSATGSWGGPVWVAKLMVPAGSCLLALAWLTHILKAWQKALKGPSINHD